MFDLKLMLPVSALLLILSLTPLSLPFTSRSTPTLSSLFAVSLFCLIRPSPWLILLCFLPPFRFILSTHAFFIKLRR